MEKIKNMYPRIIQKFDNFIVNLVNKYAERNWYSSPLTKKPKGTKEDYLKLAAKAKLIQFPLVDQIETENHFRIDNQFLDNLALHTQVGIKKSDICYQHGRLLYSFLRMYISKNEIVNINVFETGTAKGFSAIVMAKALADSNIQGKIFTFDVLPHTHKMYWNTIDDTEGKKTREELLKEYKYLIDNHIVFHQGNTKTELKRTHIPRIHFAFLDAVHDYSHVLTEFNYLINKQQKNDIIFFDDYSETQFPGVVKAVDEICFKNNYSKRIIKISNNRTFVIAEKNDG